MAALCLLFCAGCGVLLSSYVGLLALKYFFLCSVSLVVVSTVCFSMVLVCVSSYLVSFFFFNQKTASEMRISAWSSDVCSSDLTPPAKCRNRRRLPRRKSNVDGCVRTSRRISGYPAFRRPPLRACDRRAGAGRLRDVAAGDATTGFPDHRHAAAAGRRHPRRRGRRRGRADRKSTRLNSSH